MNVYLRMSPSFAASQAFVVGVVPIVEVLLVGRCAAGRVVVSRQTVKSLCGVEVKLIATYQVVQCEESLHFLHFRMRIVNQLICLFFSHEKFNL